MSEKTNFDVLNGKLDKILGLLSDRSRLVVTQEIENKEYFEQDFTGVTVMGETPKSWFVIKNGKQIYLAKQFIKDVQPAYPMGVPINLEVKEVADKDGRPLGWVKTKWELFKAVKNRQ